MQSPRHDNRRLNSPTRNWIAGLVVTFFVVGIYTPLNASPIYLHDDVLQSVDGMQPLKDAGSSNGSAAGGVSSVSTSDPTGVHHLSTDLTVLIDLLMQTPRDGNLNSATETNTTGSPANSGGSPVRSAAATVAGIEVKVSPTLIMGSLRRAQRLDIPTGLIFELLRPPQSRI